MRISKLKQKIPDYVFSVASVLNENKFQAYLVGGSVRDILLGRLPHDYDVATDATPEEIQSLFPRSVATGAKFGTITVLTKNKEGENFDVEITTFRSEKEYVDGRWPSVVEFSKDIKDDLKRRDFTINAMAIDLKLLIDKDVDISVALLDMFGGQSDLKAKVIRAVGDPVERLSEDGLRSLRACRLASTLGFNVDEKLFSAIQQTLHITKRVSMERVRDEMDKMLMKSPKPSIGLKLMKQTGLLKLFIPELLEGTGVVQPEYHVYDVFEHSLRTVDIAEDSIKWAALLHDIGKPRTAKEGHFYRHDIVGAEMAATILRRLHFSNREIQRVKSLVRWHMFYYPYDEDILVNSGAKHEGSLKANRKKNIRIGWSDSAIRRLIRNVGGQEGIDDLIRLRIADATANPKSEFDPGEIEALSARISEVRAKEMVISFDDLDITGHDLMELGIEKGPKIKEVMEYLLNIVIEDPILNEKKTLQRYVREKFL